MNILFNSSYRSMRDYPQETKIVFHSDYQKKRINNTLKINTPIDITKKK